MPPPGNLDRRRLLSLLIGTISVFVSGSLAAIFGRFVRGSASSQDDGGVSVSLGRLSDWPDAKGPVERTISCPVRDGYFRENRRQRIFLTRVGLAPAVFSATCTHLGCAVSWEAGSRTFRCPCHGGIYREDGTVAAGPPPRPLKSLPVEVRAGEVFVRPGDLA